VGRIDLQASLKSGNYLGSGLATPTATTNTSTSGCTGAVGPFVPGYFSITADPNWTRKATTATVLPQYYSGEPAIKLNVTAYSLQNSITQNYAGTYARDVAFSALNADGTALDPKVAGTFSRSASYPATDTTGTAQLRAADFVAGVGTWTGSWTFTQPPAQAPLRIRATEIVPATQPPSPAGASSAPIVNIAASGVEPTLQLRSGRIRLPSRFGPAGTALKIPVSLEYWTGRTWVLNAEDTTTTVPAGAVYLGTAMGNSTGSLTTPFTNGQAFITVTPGTVGRGSIPFALNLGTTTTNTSCYGAKQAMTSSTGANLAFLRAVDASCAAANAVDPSAMATFGVYPPETKRIIHMREVFR
jgi:MSHA biogenesis protein MshQ